MDGKLITLCAAALLTGGSADAAVVTATYTGFFNDGSEAGSYPLFGGSSDLDLTGLSFSLALTFDNSLGTTSVLPGGLGTQLSGAGPGPNDPLISSYLTVDGDTASLQTNPLITGPSTSGDTLQVSFDVERLRGGSSVANFGMKEVAGEYTDAFKTLDQSDVEIAIYGATDFSYTSDSFSVQDLDILSGSFQFSLTNLISGPPYAEGELVNGDFTVTGLTVNEAPSLSAQPIPEPAAWAMMLMGLSGLGAAIRARRRVPGGPQFQGMAIQVAPKGK